MVVAPSSGSGNWILVSPDWDLLWAYLSPVFEKIRVDIAASLPASKVLFGSATLTFDSAAANSYQEKTIAVSGALTTGIAIVNPPSTLPAGFHVSAYVSAANTVTVRAHNTSDSSASIAAMTYAVSVINQ